MVRLYTSNPAFFNDIADELRLFAGRAEITEAASPTEAELSVTLNKAPSVWTAEAHANIEGRAGGSRFEGESARGGVLEEKRLEKRYMKIAAFRALKEAFGFAPPWGSLTGIRPTRLFRELEGRLGNDGAQRAFREDFDVSEEKLALATEIVGCQRPIIESLGKERDVDVYINIPFCLTKCLYCSFPSGVRTKKTDMKSYLCALGRDMRAGAEILKESGRRVRAMYIGGGTPTVLECDELRYMLSSALEAYGGFGAELTLEAGRPDTITREKLDIMKKAGVTRISINPQSMNAATLELIGRSHTPGDVARAMDMAREAGFDNINMDVIAGLPLEDTDKMKRTLEDVSALSPESLTVHTLALKRSSRLVTEPETYRMPEAEEVEKMVAMGEVAARALNMRPYYMYRQKYMSGNLENVGYVKPGLECIYNIDMMEDIASIMSSGAGSMTKCVYDAERRVERVPSPKEISVYESKLDKLTDEKRRLFLGESR